MDEIDLAAQVIDEMTLDAIKEVRSQIPKPKEELNPDDLICDCGQEIPEKRVRMGYCNCIDCQRYLEKQHKVSKMRDDDYY